MSYWEQGPGTEETRSQLLQRLDRNLSSMFSDIDQNVMEHKQELGKVVERLGQIESSLHAGAHSLQALVELLQSMTASDQGNILERAYMLAVMQERQELKEQLSELQSLAAKLKEASNEEEVRQASEGAGSAEPS